MAQSSWILGVQTEERKGRFQPLAFHNVTRTARLLFTGVRVVWTWEIRLCLRLASAGSCKFPERLAASKVVHSF